MYEYAQGLLNIFPTVVLIVAIVMVAAAVLVEWVTRKR